MNRPIRILTSLVVAGTLVAGCGDDDDGADVRDGDVEIIGDDGGSGSSSGSGSGSSSGSGSASEPAE